MRAGPLRELAIVRKPVDDLVATDTFENGITGWEPASGASVVEYVPGTAEPESHLMRLSSLTAAQGLAEYVLEQPVDAGAGLKIQANIVRQGGASPQLGLGVFGPDTPAMPVGGIRAAGDPPEQLTPYFWRIYDTDVGHVLEFDVDDACEALGVASLVQVIIANGSTDPPNDVEVARCTLTLATGDGERVPVYVEHARIPVRRIPRNSRLLERLDLQRSHESTVLSMRWRTDLNADMRVELAGETYELEGELVNLDARRREGVVAVKVYGDGG